MLYSPPFEGLNVLQDFSGLLTVCVVCHLPLTLGQRGAHFASSSFNAALHYV